jgi:hypothetical protein
MNIADIAADGSRAHLAAVLPALPDNGRTTARIHFDSLAELVAFIPPTAPPGVKDGDATHWSAQDESFYGKTKSMKDALTLARDGWKDGADRARPLLDRVKVARPAKKRLTRHDVAGAVAVVPRYLAGNPLAMKTRQTSPTAQSPVITLVSATSAPWYVRPEDFEYAAVAAAAIIDRLEDAGFRVEVIAGRRESNNGNGAGEGSGANNTLGDRSEIYFRLKAAQDALDLDRLVFGLGHPAVHRRLLFAAGSMHPAFKKSLGYCQGYAVSLDNLERPAGTFILPSMLSVNKGHHKDAMTVFDKAVEALKAQGCPGLE